MKSIKIALVACALATIAPAPAFAADPAGGPMELPAADRAFLDDMLGKGVVGAPVAGNPIADVAKAFAFEDGARTFRFVSGDNKGQTQQDTLTVSRRDTGAVTGQYAEGPRDIIFLRRSDDGGVVLVSERDQNEGVITKYAPPEPILIAGFKPGDSETRTIQVKVYDLSDPKDVSHTGSLNVTYSYLGAYRVNVPAGTYDAALLKWDYEGEVGPASISDVQYRLIAKDVGMVASVDKLKIHAVLIYNKTTKDGKVLVADK